MAPRSRWLRHIPAMSLDDSKRAARQAARARRAGISSPGAAERAASNLLAHLGTLDRCGIVSAYLPRGDELDPLPAMQMLHDEGWRLCVPVVTRAGAPLAFREWTPNSDLVTRAFGISEPASGAILVPDILVLPLLAFDRSGNRLGYGGGFYDRTLAELRERDPIAIGLAFAGQEVERVPVGPMDMPLDAVVTEKEVIVLRRTRVGGACGSLPRPLEPKA